MHDLVSLIADIRSALAFSESVPPYTLERYARYYAEVCTKFNERLRLCLPHLRNGHVAEAVRLAEQPPILTEVFQLLDFENREEWLEICDSLGFDVPPPLARDIYEELTAAYIQAAPLEPMLRWHRLYALNRSPLRDRLAVLRALSKADPMTLSWQSDQEDFEQARIKELKQEVAKTLAGNDFSQLQNLYQELTSSGWRVPLPQDLRQQVCAAVLQKHAEELLQHFSAFDLSRVSAAYRSMEQILSFNQMPMPAEIAKEIQPAVQWMRETALDASHLSQYQKDTEALAEALDESVPHSILDNLYYALQHSASQAGQSIPPDLERRYRSRIENIVRTEHHRHRILVAVIAGSLILTASAIVYGLAERSFNHRVDSALAALQKIETENRVDDIAPTLKTIDSKIAGTQEIAAIIARLQRVYDAAQSRSKEFERYYSQAALLLEQATDQKGLNTAKSSLDQAGRLKRTDQETLRYTDLLSQYNRQFSQLQTSEDGAFGRELAVYRQRYNALPRSATEQFSSDDLTGQLNEITELVNRLLIQYPSISSGQREEADSFLAALNERRSMIRQTALESDAFRNLSMRIRDLPSFKRELDSFAVRYPKHPAAEDITAVLKDFDVIRKVADSLTELNRNYADASDDFDRLRNAAGAMYTEYQAVTTQCTDLEQVFPPAKYLKLLALMKPINADTFKSTEELLKTVARRDLYPWIDSDGNWYYLTAKPLDEKNERIKSANFKYATTLIAEPLDYEEMSQRDTERNKGMYELIQSDFCKQTLRKIDTILARTSDDSAKSIGSILIQLHQTPSLDPLFKLIVSHSLISEYSKIDPIFASHFAPIVNRIQEDKLDLSVNWMDVDGVQVITQRQIAAVILDRLKSSPDVLQTAFDEMIAETGQFRAAVTASKPMFEFTGLLKKQDGRWTYSDIKPFPAASGKLIVLQNSGGIIHPIEAGGVTGQRVTLPERINVLNCSPVFFISADNSFSGN